MILGLQKGTRELCPASRSFHSRGEARWGKINKVMAIVDKNSQRGSREHTWSKLKWGSNAGFTEKLTFEQRSKKKF